LKTSSSTARATAVPYARFATSDAQFRAESALERDLNQWYGSKKQQGGIAIGTVWTSGATGAGTRRGTRAAINDEDQPMQH
jgi:hypothetical protein